MHQASHRLLNCPAAGGHSQRITLQPADSNVQKLWAVYMPHNVLLNKQVCQVLRDNMSKTDHMNVAGDWDVERVLRPTEFSSQ